MLQWLLILFGTAFAIGIISPMSGVGGGVLFVPLATALFPFSVDFVRGAGLIMALTSSLSSSPYLIRKGLTDVRIMAPVAAVSILTSVLGGIVGLWLTNAIPRGEGYFMISLGVILLFMFAVMIMSKRVEYPAPVEMDPLSKLLRLEGTWFEPTLAEMVSYRTARLPLGMLLFGGVGFVAGVFGVGAGWASVPVLNLVMNLPIKVAVATSMVTIEMSAASAVWVYMSKGAVLPLLCVPSVVGVAVGARIGGMLAAKSRPVVVKYLVLGIMVFAAVIDIVKGLRGIGLV